MGAVALSAVVLGAGALAAKSRALKPLNLRPMKRQRGLEPGAKRAVDYVHYEYCADRV